MKDIRSFFAMLAVFVSFLSYAQPNKESFSDGLRGNAELLADDSYHSAKDIKSYRVEERINMNFGGRITTYEVSCLSLVSTNDLGPNNVRVITPKYVKAKPVVSSQLKVKPIEIKAKGLKPISNDLHIPLRKKDYVEIDIARSYERILEKGYVDVKMLYIVADRRFFDGDLSIAAKWYAILFEVKKDLDPIYYYRYAECLRAIGKTDLANEIQSVFENSIK